MMSWATCAWAHVVVADKRAPHRRFGLDHEALDAGLVLDAMTEAKLRSRRDDALPRGRLDEARCSWNVATNLARTAGDEALLAWR